MITKPVEQAGFIYIYLSNESNTTHDVYFDDFRITHTKSKILQEDHYYPFGLSISALSSSAPLSKPNRYKFNGGTEFNTDIGLNWYETTHRGLDVTLGRFMQVDPMADMLTSINPYNFGFNNPIKFNDPTGLIGESNDKKKDCPEGDCDDNVYRGGSAGTVIVVGRRRAGSANSYVGGYWSYYLNKWKNGNAVERGLYANYRENGLSGVQNVLSHSRTLNMSSEGYEDVIAHSQAYMSDIGKIYAYGVGGSILVTAAAPILIEMVVAKTETMVADMLVELSSQIFTNLIVDQRVGWENLDIADIILAGFTKPGMGDVVGATVDLTYDGGFSYLGKGDKSLNNVIGDAILGSITTGQRQLMDKSSITDINKYILDAFNKTKVSVVEKAVNKNE
tara:strand:+ start:1 stop:1176 length:1176 start_codon:yes stop_codon:yes gene_type:complete